MAQLVHTFQGGSDGATPNGDLTQLFGSVYGTTNAGGDGCSGGCGTVFSLDSSGAEKVLYAFKGGKDGATPNPGLTWLDGAFYGTTRTGGAYNMGTVFFVTLAGKEKVVHSFGAPGDPGNPVGGLTNVGGHLYGAVSAGFGAIFEISPQGKEQVVYNFALGTGWNPTGVMTNVNGTLYGATVQGPMDTRACGSENGYDYGCGVIFAFTP